ncbi:MAG: branched-chain amino acid ABC transporter permease [Desulfovibrionaceae bacterium]|nr:branched-chain amino acid ABC transporter permease [Desulfovibrionaceae bacterium]
MKTLLRAVMISVWFMALTFPVLSLKVNATKRTVDVLWERAAGMGLAMFALSLLWMWYFRHKERGRGDSGPLASVRAGMGRGWHALLRRLDSLGRRRGVTGLCAGVLLAAAVFLPVAGSMYQTTIFANAFLYVMLALGLNIAVGIAGQLVLGYAAFYAIGAYTYGLLNQYFGLGFWVCLPVGGCLAAVAGLLLGFPVLRLQGDYLAIVTLGFGEIVRLLLNNWMDITGGSQGVANIPRPSLFGITLSSDQSMAYVYYLTLAAMIVTIVVVARIKDSRVGLALRALRDDEIASEAMGIDLRMVKLQAFALGSCWAGFAGVLLAARINFISPPSFTFMESAMILSMVVLGGMGSISGVVVAALVLTLAPEYLRALSAYRMLVFGALMVLMMIFRPQGLIPSRKRIYHPRGVSADGAATSAQGGRA